MFPCKFCEIFKNTFFKEHLRATASVLYQVKLPPADLSEDIIIAKNIYGFYK